MVTSSAAGPVLGGWITDILSWHWVFWISVPTGFALMFASMFLIRIDKAEPSLARNIDFLGISLAATALLCLLVVLEEGRRHDWFDSRLILSLTLVSGLSAYLFLWRELTCRHPVVDLRAFFESRLFDQLFLHLRVRRNPICAFVSSTPLSCRGAGNRHL